MPTNDSPASSSEDHGRADGTATVRLQLYVARSTPNSVRASSNLDAALTALNVELAGATLEVIDVFTQPKRALTDGVMVTPMLILTSGLKRVVLMGDLSDRDELDSILAFLVK